MNELCFTFYPPPFSSLADDGVSQLTLCYYSLRDMTRGSMMECGNTPYFIRLLALVVSYSCVVESLLRIKIPILLFYSML